MVFKINNSLIGPDHPPYIIAEMSANHNGSLERALQTINEAKRCGADAVKIQTYTADTMTIDCDLPDFMVKGGLWDGYKLYDLYKWAETPYEWHEAMFSYAHKIGITVFSTPFDESAVDLLEDLNTPAYKIASFEILDLPLIRFVAKTKKPIIMSTGMASEEEINEAVVTAREAGCKQLLLLHCISSYPAPIEQSNIRQIPNLAERFNVITGLSDHTLGTTVAVAAVSQGACLIEKHFTLSRKDKGPDSDFSLEPEEFQKLCRDTKNAWLSLGKASFVRQEAEKNSKVFRRSLYFVKNLQAGDLIRQEDVRRIRPGMGLAPKYLDKIIGKKLKINVIKGQAVSFNYFE
jgi:pseudaminic acid synthase